MILLMLDCKYGQLIAEGGQYGCWRQRGQQRRERKHTCCRYHHCQKAAARTPPSSWWPEACLLCLCVCSLEERSCAGNRRKDAMLGIMCRLTTCGG